MRTRCIACRQYREVDEIDELCAECGKVQLAAMLEELRGAEQILAVLDQVACVNGTRLSRMYSVAFGALMNARDEEMAEWNAQSPNRRIYRCENAGKPYHALVGACEIYTELPHCCATCVAKLCWTRVVS